MTATPDDELASAVLDGRLTRDDEAAALRDPAVARRVAEMRAARAALRSAPAPRPDAERREQAVAAALAAFDAARAGAGAPTSAPRPLDERRARRDRRAAVPRWLAAAAALLVVIALGGALATLSSPSVDDDAAQSSSEGAGDSDLAEGREDASGGAAEEEAARSTAEAADDPTAAPGGDVAAEVSPQDTPAPSAGSFEVDLSAASTGDELATRASDAVASPRTLADAPPTVPPGGGEGASASCPLPAAAGDAPILLRGRATLAGAPVQVWVLDVGGGRRVLAADASCAVVVDRTVAA
jgi:hypothetical protein